MFIYDADIFEIISRRILPSFYMDSCGVIMVVLLLTDGYLISLRLIPKERSQINFNGRILCGIAATGEIFKFGRILLLVTFHLITVANPYFTIFLMFLV